MSERALRPYEALVGGESPDRAASAEPETAWKFWVGHRMRPEDLVPPVAWDELFSDNRSLRYHLHALDPIGLPLAAYSHAPDRRWIDRALALALDWLDAHPSPEVATPFAWYDMAVGLRAYRLGYLLDVAARDESRSEDAVRQLLNGVQLHLETLADETQFAAHSNHGLYQAAGQLALVLRFPELDESGHHRVQAENRLAKMISEQFTDEGVHTEHSPGYHRMMLATLVRLADSGLIDDPETVERIETIEEALSWFVRPDRVLATIGDTDAGKLPRMPFGNARSAALRLMATGGDEGSSPGKHLQAFPDSGYVVFRECWPSGPGDFSEGAHLVQTCSFHSRTHKHADDLSFTWFERGQEILVDPGRFGYRRAGEMPPELASIGHMYSDPQRIYVESTRAHNTVEIDGESHNRRAEPYGSALDSWGQSDDIFWARSSVTFENRVKHERLLALRPKGFLLVVDHLADRSGGAHRFCQRFHAAPELSAHPQGEGVTLSFDDERAPDLQVATFTGARFCGVTQGQHEPDLLGWISREQGSFQPSPTFAFEFENVTKAHFATLFWWGSSTQPPFETILRTLPRPSP